MKTEKLNATASRSGDESNCYDKASQHSWLSIHRAGPVLFGAVIGGLLGLLAYTQHWL